MKVKSEIIRRFIIDSVEDHPRDIASLVGKEFEISRQAVNRHMKTLIEDGVVETTGKTSDRVYSLKINVETFTFLLEENKEEHIVWEKKIQPLVYNQTINVFRILMYGFTEMFNNVLDHSDGTSAEVEVRVTAKSVMITIADNGVGIFEKIKSRFNLADHREAVLELSKGKLTTDPNNHSGQGIFFTSRMFDQFLIRADHLFFSHKRNKNKDDDWLIETSPKNNPGTTVYMAIDSNSQRTAKEVFDQYTDLESGDYAFSKTHVPVSLAKYDGEQLVSRSQAKRVLSRFERFKEVFLDFNGVESIGQAFADEIFRVYSRNNPHIEIIAIHANKSVQEMINRARSPQSDPSS